MCLAERFHGMSKTECPKGFYFFIFLALCLVHFSRWDILFRSEYVTRTVECDILHARWYKKMHPINIICTYICVFQASEQIQLTFLSFPFSLMKCSLKLNVVFLHNYTFQKCFAHFDSTTANT